MKVGECLKLTVMHANILHRWKPTGWWPFWSWHGCSVWVPRTNRSGEYHVHKDKWHLKELSTLFQCEVYSINKTAEWLHRVGKNEAVINVDSQAVINIDSQAAIKASQSNVINSLLVKETVESLNTRANSMKVTIRRVNSHVDDSVAHRGIASTDTLAKKGAADMKAPRVPDLLKLILIHWTIVNHDYKTK